jgi:putative nucleotidyltransferase with HDIG domain
VVPAVVTSFLVHVPVVALLVAAYSATPWATPLFLIPALAAQRVYNLYQRQRRLTEEVTEANDRLIASNTALESANFSFATALVQTLEESDRYTAGHSRAVATYARDVATRMGLEPVQQEVAFLSGLVHDIGKIGLPASVLNKEGRLTLEERRAMETHSEIGERILSKVEAYADIAEIVRHHHERFDGEGYPDRLRGDSIPPISRIIAVADAYNAMTSDRPYRKAMQFEVARDRLLQAMGSQFFADPVVAFLAVLSEASDDYRFARGSGFGATPETEVYSLFDSSAADAA